jgi:hypothetical protein
MDVPPPHHSLFDSTTSQHKNYTIGEIKAARARLYELVGEGKHLAPASAEPYRQAKADHKIGNPDLQGQMAVTLKPQDTETLVQLVVRIVNRGSASVVKDWQLEATCGEKKILVLALQCYSMNEAPLNVIDTGIPQGGSGTYKLRYTLPFSYADLRNADLSLELTFCDVLDNPCKVLQIIEKTDWPADKSA